MKSTELKNIKNSKSMKKKLSATRVKISLLVLNIISCVSNNIDTMAHDIKIKIHSCHGSKRSGVVPSE